MWDLLQLTASLRPNSNYLKTGANTDRTPNRSQRLRFVERNKSALRSAMLALEGHNHRRWLAVNSIYTVPVSLVLSSSRVTSTAACSRELDSRME